MDTPPLPFALPLIAILRGITPDDVPAHVGALVEEGYDAIEIPTNSPEWTRRIAISGRAKGRVGASMRISRGRPANGRRRW